MTAKGLTGSKSLSFEDTNKTPQKELTFQFCNAKSVELFGGALTENSEEILQKTLFTQVDLSVDKETFYQQAKANKGNKHNQDRRSFMATINNEVRELSSSKELQQHESTFEAISLRDIFLKKTGPKHETECYIMQNPYSDEKEGQPN